LTANGLELHETERGTSARYPDSSSEGDRARIDAVLSEEKLEEQFGITLAEMSQLKLIRHDLMKLLGESAELKKGTAA
jgi:hypothetical protein